MNPNNLKVPRPSIIVNVSDRLKDEDALDKILYGAEEEGIPVEVNRVSGDDAYQLAFDASKSSVLLIGIGVSSSEGVVQNAKMAKDKPIDAALLSDGEELLRQLGSNAARMAKRVPLRFRKK